jgi:hypothetical protein
MSRSPQSTPNTDDWKHLPIVVIRGWFKAASIRGLENPNNDASNTLAVANWLATYASQIPFVRDHASSCARPSRTLHAAAGVFGLNTD